MNFQQRAANAEMTSAYGSLKLLQADLTDAANALHAFEKASRTAALDPTVIEPARQGLIAAFEAACGQYAIAFAKWQATSAVVKTTAAPSAVGVVP